MKRRGFLGFLLSAPLVAKEAVKESQLTEASPTIKFPDGSASTPSYAFNGDTNTGWYTDPFGYIEFAINGRPVKVPYYDK